MGNRVVGVDRLKIATGQDRTAGGSGELDGPNLMAMSRNVQSELGSMRRGLS